MVTMKEIADSLGISKSTVSLVLAGKDAKRVSPELSARVRSRAAEMGYVFNNLASSLRTNRTRMLGFISDDIATTPYAGRLILGAQDAARALGYMLLTVNSNGSEESRASEIDGLKQYGVDGFLFACMYNRFTHLPEGLKESPTVIVDAAERDGAAPSIRPDEEAIGRTATARLLDAGCRRIAFIGSHGPMEAQRGRLAGYRHELHDHAVAFNPDLVVNVEMGRDGVDKVHDLVEREHPDGFFCFNGARAWYVYEEAARRGLNVGTDISVVGVDNHQMLAEMLSPKLSTIELPHYEMGYWGILKLVEIVEGRRLDDARIPTMRAPLPSLDERAAEIPCTLVDKESVCARC